ncbi:MAG: hypothetical protein M3N51_07090, partial [Actinomycetota bacterium]|nr:hypothetical protein [Actinomycetota bacterium]
MGGTAEGSPGRRAPRLARDVVVVAIGLALGVGLAYLLNGRLPGRDPGLPELELASPTPPPPSSKVVPEEEPVEEPVPSAAVASAQAAVEGFLDAEMSGDLDASYRFLSEADRQAFGSPEGWVASHPDLLPPILGY